MSVDLCGHLSRLCFPCVHRSFYGHNLLALLLTCLSTPPNHPPYYPFIKKAAVLAAMDAGLDMRCLPLAIPLAVMHPKVLARTAAFPSSSSSSSSSDGGAGEGAMGEGEGEGEGNVLLLDPTAAEEKAAAATMVRMYVRECIWFVWCVMCM